MKINYVKIRDDFYEGRTERPKAFLQIVRRAKRQGMLRSFREKTTAEISFEHDLYYSCRHGRVDMYFYRYSN